MPYMICPTCRLTSYSAAGRATHDRCPRCDVRLDAGDRADDRIRRWNPGALRGATRPEGVEHGAR
jgi:Zn-finger nucleic acid-binding protein